MKALSQDNLNYKDLASIIVKHPGIAARLIALANSAWAAPVCPVNSIDVACSRLGLNLVRSISIGLAVIAPFNVSQCPNFDIHRYWVTGMLVAEGAVFLANAWQKDHAQQDVLPGIHTAGVLHNLGLLCMADLLSKEVEQAFLLRAKSVNITVTDALQRTAATDYCEVGGWLAEQWGLPEDLVAIMRHHRNPDYRGHDWLQASLIGYAALMVSALIKQQEQLPGHQYSAALNIDSELEANVFSRLSEQLPKVIEMAQAVLG